MKELLNKIKKRIEKSNITKLIKFRSTIKELEKKIGDLETEKQKLNDKVQILEYELKKLDELENKIPSMELIIANSDKTLKNKIEKIKQLESETLQLQCELFDAKNEIAKANMKKEEYEAQIKDLKSNRYLVKKVRSGRTPNTNKTKISRPMSGNVVKYMRGEHE